MKFQDRGTFGWGESGGAYATPRSGIVIHYDSANQGLAGKSHEACVSYWKRTRQFHMNTRGWLDIGYTAAACVHGYVMEGRGLNKEQAAQPGGNASWYSITLMSGPDEDPTDAQIQAVREFRAWLMDEHGVDGAVRGHRDFISTSCPGDRLYRLVQDGTFGQAPSEEDDDMPDYISVSTSQEKELPAGEWVTLDFDNEHSDAAHHHWDRGGPSVIEGPARYALTANLKIEGLEPGTELQARAIERDDDSGDVEGGPIAEYVASGGATFVHYPVPAAAVGKGARVRVQVIQYGEVAGRVVSASVKALAWRT
ncbi:peptidoglycan recognition family protein [Actinomadura sp. 21ATH]|uniref:peptidoglycan recognition protein family protein n=1 Tax=Actinomadura sp. 21ATH TaxID=1735444 RepID=UPI0035C22261